MRKGYIPSSLKSIKEKKYKIKGLKGYFLLDCKKDIEGGFVANLFYDRKWRQNNWDIENLEFAIS